MNLDRAQIVYLFLLAMTLFAVWVFKVRPAGHGGIRGWATALGVIGVFMGAVLVVLKLAGY